MKPWALKSSFIAVVCAQGWLSIGPLGAQQAVQQKPPVQSRPASKSGGPIIWTDSALPKTYPHAVYNVRLEVRGDYVPPLHWKVESGALPPGITFDDRGVLYGEPMRAGEYHFTISLTDSGKPQQQVQKEFVLAVVEAMSLVWTTPAHVSGNRIEGSVEVSNTTSDDMDLTFIVLAVAENGRATAIGYQHFVLRRATVAQRIPFGETLPHGDYVVHLDAVGEVAARNAIYRRHLQTDKALQVLVGP